jgi:sulfane dehydrogenase subunit SoxC
MDKCFTRFTIAWKWRGDETVLLSRATDERGNTQPTRELWKSRYAEFTFNNYNAAGPVVFPSLAIYPLGGVGEVV